MTNPKLTMHDEASTEDAVFWSYVHGQLPEERQAVLRRQLGENPASQSRVRELAQFDRTLRTALARRNETDDALADRALAAWEQQSASPAGRRVYLPMLVALAAAAGLVALCLPLLPARAPQWRPPQFHPLVTRGAAPVAASEPRPTPETAARCQQGLRDELSLILRSRALHLPRGVVFSLSLQELPQGTFVVRVQAHDRRGGSIGDWWGDYSSLAAFERHRPASAAHMAQTLAFISSGL